MQFIWRYIEDLAGKGLDFFIIAEFIIYVSARLVPMALPLAVLLSSLMTFGNLGENFELTSIKSSGISLQRFMSPLIFISVLISVGAFFYANHVIPYSNLKAGALIYDIQQQRPELQIKEGVFYNGIDGYSIKVAEKNHKTNLLKNIMIYDHSDQKGNNRVTIADSGYMRMTADEKFLIVTLYDGATYEEMEETKNDKRTRNYKYPHQKIVFEEYNFYFELTGFNLERSDEELFKNNYHMYNLDQLEYAIDSLETEHYERVKNFKNNEEAKNLFLQRKLIESEKLPPKKRTPNKKETKFQNLLAQSDNEKLVIDSLLAILEPVDKQVVIGQAINSARKFQNAINNSRNHFNYKLERLHRHEIEWHRKFSLAFACLVFFFIGAPLGAIIRKGGFGTPVVISIILFIIYYIISLTGEKFTREGILPAYFGMWLSSFILLPLGIFLTYKATTDSVILNIDTYFAFLKRIPFFSQKKNQVS